VVVSAIVGLLFAKVCKYQEGFLMNNPQLFVWVFFGLLAIYQLWVTVLICRADEYDSKQRNLQCLVIWLLPFLGALICQLVLRSSRAPIMPANTDFVQQSPDGDMPQHGNATD
jgi:hypothetical protein